MTERLHLKNYSFESLFQAEVLAKLDNDFLTFLQRQDAALYHDLMAYRQQQSFAPIQVSELLIAVAKLLEDFIVELFSIEVELEQSRQQAEKYSPIFTLKKWIVMRRAKRQLLRDENLASFEQLSHWLIKQLPEEQLEELAVAQYAEKLLGQKEAMADEIEKLTDWCVQAIKTTSGQRFTEDWISLKLPQRKDYQRLIPLKLVTKNNVDCIESNRPLRQRDGFQLTDQRMSLPKVLDEANYCIYCHQNDGDFCAKGFPEKKSGPNSKLKKNELDNILTGCPLEEKISEMNLLKAQAHTVAALAMVMVDNPMCPVTGHRICNDCMKACIYQKQDAVNIPEIETRVLTDVLALPWGVEIYDLLVRWNPLRQQQWVARPHNGRKVLIAGMGPAGFTLAHHLLMEGVAVTGVDGLKIEPINDQLIHSPIKDFEDIKEDLNERLMAGFGGVAEYGITVRWDKNFLKLIYISLMRRPHFQVWGDVRFGGTITVEDAWQLGFDHVAIAVGAGLAKALPISGSLAPGMRQANDFLMALQLTGAAKSNSLANLQLRLPALVIGSGLTAIDTATEAQAYYIRQVETIYQRYLSLRQIMDEQAISKKLNISSQHILNEFIDHAKMIGQERQRAKQANEQPDFIKLVRQWGGVSIVYRRKMTESPAYLTNHEELDKALEEGVFYYEGLQPKEALLDQYGHIQAMSFTQHQEDEHQVWHDQQTSVRLAAASILVATGAQLNVAYAFEHPNTFKRDGFRYENYQLVNQQLQAVAETDHVKQTPFGPFTSYQKQGRYVSFIGDTHPTFHGSVVKAIASAQKTYPAIIEALDQLSAPTDQLTQTNQQQRVFQATLIAIEICSSKAIELTIHAPMAAQKWQPGQFFRLQSFEQFAPIINGQKRQLTALPLLAFDVNQQKGTLKFMVQAHHGIAFHLCSQLEINKPISLMGPTGVRSKIPDNQAKILIVGQQQSLAYIRAVAPALRQAGNDVTYVGIFDNIKDVYCRQLIEDCSGRCIWVSQSDKKIDNKRQKDFYYSGDVVAALLAFAKQDQDETLQHINRVTVIGSQQLLNSFQQARSGELAHYLRQTSKVFANAYVPMQCMLKGVCAQCLQWQIDPDTGQRNKAVFACSWQDQPLEIIDLDNLEQRQQQDELYRTINRLWLDSQL